MTDPIHEQVSSFLDGELPAAESELLLKRLERDPQLRNTVGRYSLIGEALRSTEAGGPTRDFAARVSRAIEQEEAPGKSWRPVTNWLKPVAGGAIAAGVAAVALVSLQVGPVARTEGNLAKAAIETPSVPVIADTQQAVAQQPVREAMPSDTVPMGGGNFPAPPIQVVNSGRLANFVVAHSEYSTPLVRRNVLTSLLSEEAVDQNSAGDASSGPATTEPASQPAAADRQKRGLATR